MDCEEVDRILSARPAAELTPQERAGVAAHAAGCDACRKKWNLEYQSQELYDAVKPQRSLEGVKDAVLAKIGGKPPEPADDAANQEPAKPKRLGGFDLIGRLGRGGMGTVLKARQISMDRIVALKILPQRLAKNKDFVKRFIREARAAARLRHPNIVQAYDVGVAEGHYYFAMEYVDGQGLEAIVRRDGPLDQNRALELMKQTCSALAAAHKAGIVHRDIKPANLMVDSEGEVRVTDFGLAKRTEGDIAVTADGHALGTPAYVAPEVASGKDADARSDLYSLGAAFFHILAGRPPFEGRNFSEIVVKQVNENPPALGEVAPHVDPRLCDIIDRLLRKEPAERYASARALLEELEALGTLQSAGEAARAEGRAMIMKAPTVPLSAGKRLERLAAARELQRRQRAGKRRATRIAAIASAGVLLLAIVIVALATRGGREPQAVAPPRDSTVGHVQPVNRREQDAATLLRKAQRAAVMRRWSTAKGHLARLDKDYADTKCYAEKSAAIAELRAKVEAALRPPPDRKIEPPKPERPNLLDLPTGQWASLFDGRTLKGWSPVEGGMFRRLPAAAVEQGAIILLPGHRCWTGLKWAGGFPTVDYELEAEVCRVEGSGDFFYILFPAGKEHGTLIVGGWRGVLVGLDLLDGVRADANETLTHWRFPTGQWFTIRLRVTEAKVEAWIDGKQVVDLPRTGRKLSLYPRYLPAAPFAVFASEAKVAVRNLRLRRIEGVPAPPDPHGEWASLFDGKSLSGWQVLREGGFAQGGPVSVARGRILLARGAPRTGIAWTGEVPTADYEIAVTARRETGSDSFCGVYFPIGDSVCTLSVGGYGGRWVGLANVDGRGARDNGTGKQMTFEKWRWYRIRLRVTQAAVQGWVNEQQVFDVPRAGREFTPSLPDVPAKLALITWETSAAVSAIRMRRLEPEAPPVGEQWTSLFDGKTLEGWKVAEGAVFDGHGPVTIEEGCILLGQGKTFTGVACTKPFPKAGYEVALEVQRFKGREAGLCNIVLPVGRPSCILSVGGFGGTVVGVTFVDGQTADKNITGRRMAFDQERWYEIRLRVTADRMEAWAGDEQVLDLRLDEHELKLPGGYGALEPFGVYAERSGRTALRNIRLRTLRPEAVAAPPPPPQPWVSLFDGRTLAGWRVAVGDRFGADGEATVQNGELVLAGGQRALAITHTGGFPETDYELAWEMRKLRPQMEVCGVLFPVAPTHCLLFLGPVTGFCFLDGRPMFRNPSCRLTRYEPNRWYRLRLRVTEARAAVWLDDEQVIDVPRRYHHLTSPGGHGALRPLGFWVGAGQRSALRTIRYRPVEPEPEPPPPDPAEGEHLAKATVPLHARWVWADTGLHVQKGATYRLTAAGRWGADLKSSCGPQGDPAKPAPAGCPLPGVPSYAVIGRVDGDDKPPRLRRRRDRAGRLVPVPVDEGGKPFLVGAGCTLVPEASGRLCLMSNNVEPWNTWGMVRVAVEGPLVADRSAWLVERFTRVLGRVTVPAREENIKTDIEVKKGDVLLLEAEGKWSPGAQACDADGLDKIGDRLRLGMLHASPGGQGSYQIGRFRVVEFLSPGQLELSIHDPDNKDNSGSVAVTIRAFQKPGQVAAPPVPPPGQEGWKNLFDGKSLNGWRLAQQGAYAKHGRVHVDKGRLVLEKGKLQTGIAWTRAFPTTDYEVRVEAMRLQGENDFASMLFPVGHDKCFLVINGYGNRIVGLSNVDTREAAKNQTARRIRLQNNRWYRVRLRVTRQRIEAWIDDRKVVDLPTARHTFTPPHDNQPLMPFGIESRESTAALRTIMLRQLAP